MRVTIKKPQEFEAKYRKENAIRTNEVNTLYQQFKCVWLTNIKIAFGTKTQKSQELMKELLVISDFFKIALNTVNIHFFQATIRLWTALYL